HQVQLELRAADAREMPVTLDEARDRQLSLQIDDLRAGTDHRLDLVRGAERLDAIPADRDRLGFRAAVVHRHDAAVGEHEIRGRRLRRTAALSARLDRERADEHGKADERNQGLSHGGDYSRGGLEGSEGIGDIGSRNGATESTERTEGRARVDSSVFALAGLRPAVTRIRGIRIFKRPNRQLCLKIRISRILAPRGARRREYAAPSASALSLLLRSVASVSSVAPF